MSRPQVSIDRITPRRIATEPRESMNCKSCRKRKIKCNRLRPSCEACKVFQCPCIYDAVPKKRGPKTDVLEALLKRVDGLERRLQEEKSSDIPVTDVAVSSNTTITTTTSATASTTSKQEGSVDVGDRRNTIASFQSSIPAANKGEDLSPLSFHDRRSSLGFLPSYGNDTRNSNGFDSTSSGFRQQQNSILPEAVLDTFFSRIHGRPFYILDESGTRQKHRLGQLPSHLAMAIYALTVRYTSPLGNPQGLLRPGLDYALQARREIDADNPTIENLQTLLLLSMVFFAYGLGKKTYMTLSSCTAMVFALDLYREPSPKLNLSQTEKETRRRIFWSCYIMDRFAACGSKRPCLISDHSISLRLPAGSSSNSGLFVEGEIFNNSGPNIAFMSDSRKKGQGAMALLIDITRILGVTSRYLAAGGVKGDSHFPWHSLSNLSKIRQELDIWAAGMQEIFVSIDSLFNHPDSTILLLSKLIYHLIHCLIYRPFLPVDLVELRGTGQHQSWQIEATNLCFAHSNAIAELVEFGRSSPLIEWPSFISYCVCTAGTVHVHGVHYKGLEGEVFSSSADFLAKEMQQLSWLRLCWAGVQHQREMLQSIYTCHTELVRNVANSAVRFSPVFHLEDFFDRYSGLAIDGSHVRLVDELPDVGIDSLMRNSLDGHSLYNTTQATAASMPMFRTQQHHHNHHRPLDGPEFTSSQQIIPRNSESFSNSKTQETTTTNVGFPHVPDSQYPPTLISQTSPPSYASLQRSPQIPNAFSPTLGLSPSGFLAESLAAASAPTPTAAQTPQYATFPFEAPSQTLHGILQHPANNAMVQTPGGQSHTSGGGSHATISEGSGGGGGPGSASAENDPFLTLLEQLAENENSQGGPSELDYFLSGGIDISAADPGHEAFARLEQDDDKNMVEADTKDSIVTS